MSSAQQASMEDILSSIRTSLEEETAKVLQPAAEANVADDVLDLADIDALVSDPLAGLDVPTNPDEELIDLAAFANGAVQPLGAGEAVKLDVNPAANVATALDLEDILNGKTPEVAVDIAEPAPVAADPIDSLLAELGAGEAAVVPADALEPEVEAETAAEPEVVAAEGVPVGRVDLQAFDTASGLQVGLPAEVLAAALRPMVGQWLNDNLASIVERLVKDEISKLTNQ